MIRSAATLRPPIQEICVPWLATLPRAPPLCRWTEHKPEPPRRRASRSRSFCSHSDDDLACSDTESCECNHPENSSGCADQAPRRPQREGSRRCMQEEDLKNRTSLQNLLNMTLPPRRPRRSLAPPPPNPSQTSVDINHVPCARLPRAHLSLTSSDSSKDPTRGSGKTHHSLSICKCRG